MSGVPAPARVGRTLDRLEPGTAARGAAVAGVLLVALFVVPLTGGDWVGTFTSVAIYSVVAAGLGILYGRVGMISLGQIGLLAIGTWVGARLAYGTSLPFPVLLLATGLITAAVGVLIGLPALRLSGLHLALITLMAAGAITEILNQTRFPNGGGGFKGLILSGDLREIPDVRRPSLAEGDTAYYRYVVIVCALMFALALLHVAGKAGRAWAAIRESEPAALAAGVNITLYKLWAFALASFMTGVAGCLLAAQVGTPPHRVVPDASVDHAARDSADRRYLHVLGRDRRRRVHPAAAVRLPGQVGARPQPPPHHLRRRAAASAADRSRRHRRSSCPRTCTSSARFVVRLVRRGGEPA